MKVQHALGWLESLLKLFSMHEVGLISQMEVDMAQKPCDGFVGGVYFRWQNRLHRQ
jgi:hypothetical protein